MSRHPSPLLTMPLFPEVALTGWSFLSAALACCSLPGHSPHHPFTCSPATTPYLSWQEKRVLPIKLFSTTHPVCFGAHFVYKVQGSTYCLAAAPYGPHAMPALLRASSPAPTLVPAHITSCMSFPASCHLCSALPAFPDSSHAQC